ncbi:MAG: NifU N-terminal domain-containing protein [Anaerolineaceae bacterium]|nr:NifU N-terminal domain-containing protein [Chloroflexota bacterium]MCY4009151.1 NifU N-terminal domain-containing protein [Anaerolineaceae bacterium]
MSEYVRFEFELSADPLVAEVQVNQTLTEESEERYADYAAGDEGSPLAQLIFNAVEGVAALTITPAALRIEREATAEWETLLADLRAALRDFFL